MFVEPNKNCPHLPEASLMALEEFAQINFIDHRCTNCDEKQENWVCLECGEFFCSRYVNKHFVQHFEEKSHAICIGMMDLSIWCYGCENYIVSKELDKYDKKVSAQKFSSKSGSLGDAFNKMSLGQEKADSIKYWRVIDGIKSGQSILIRS